MNTQVWLNGDFLTLDSDLPRASALVSQDGRIVLVGQDREEALRRGGGDAEVYDLGGAAVIPGFNDNHLHAVHMGDHGLALDLSGLDAPRIVELLKSKYPNPGKDEIIRAFDWDYPACPNPRKELLDAAFPDNPVALSQYSGHGSWLNSAALRVLGIDRNHSPKHGTVLRDQDGQPTGIVRDLGDTELTRRRNRDIYYNDAQRERRIDLALAGFAEKGITSVQDNTWYYPEMLGLGRRFRQGRLTARFTCWSLGRSRKNRVQMDALFRLGLGIPDWVEEGPVKFFLDGTFSTRNACLSEPFLGSEDRAECPDLPQPINQLEFLARTRRQGAFHIIGDKGISIFLDAFEKVAANYPGLKNQRIRIEHAQLIKPEDLPRIRALGVLICAQPTALGSPDKDIALLGKERAQRAYPYRSLLDSGINLSFGSDIPGESSFDPIQAIHWAVNRDGPEVISALEALQCYTMGSAYAQFAEARKGRFMPGMLADFTLLSQDISRMPKDRIASVRVLRTVVGGKTVFSRT